jgi:AcrR family transcriptional regulator
MQSDGVTYRDDVRDVAKPHVGRPRDAGIDDAVRSEALRQLARDGFAGLSLAAVAAAAGTTRPAVYRRWPDKTALVVDALAGLARSAPPVPIGAPFDDLVAELEHFRRCITEAAALPIAGLMLGDGVADEVRQLYLDHVVLPRRTRIRAHLRAGISSGELDPDADLALAVTLATGSWYALALAGTTAPRDWARRVAVLVWRSCGGGASH